MRFVNQKTIKKIWLVTAATLFVLFCIYFFSKTGPSLTLEDENCACDPGLYDLYESPIEYDYGALKGRCIDSCKFRTVKILENDRKEKRLRVANLFHKDEFWTADIFLRKGGVKGIQYLFEQFNPHVNHTSIKFDFVEPILLKSQITPGKTEEVNSLILSVEGVPPEKDKYSMLDGLLGRYVLAYRILTYSSYKAHADKKKYSLKPFTLNMSKIDAEELMRIGLKRGERESFVEKYHLLFNNCATASLDLLMAASGSSYSFEWNIEDFYDAARGLPLTANFGTLRSLKYNGFVED